ncbi:T9SS type A sorting domain-containing protein [Brumimicrobium glaciale]|uniref:T9SS type A sorting domain-containing protein n=1 Tax=Brumimicrobium glaciale TaxID=200475 RepID=A0A4Q4KQB6_9FLAO|nr:T9SS type A sorting domain-containing protein [Brumimicrobium glaciale]RYM34209.1 T9SS type A sorting domain-containing protein [Brumimicrobium glaciale]
MNTIKYFLLISSFFFTTYNYSQTAPFEISIEPMNITGLGGIQSYAFGQHNGKWLIIGGRLDGLHRRQPNAAFDIAGHNNQLIVVDPVTQTKWSAPLTSLPISIQEQLSSTNMEFSQDGEYLYCVGGYGYSGTEGDHTTFKNLTAIKVPDVINAVINNTNFTSFFRQITDPQFQVTGGILRKMGSTHYLMGGQKFIGRYNPMGPNNGPGFIQEYTDAIRKFDLVDDGTNITITHLPSHFDAANLHRRDYNAEHQIMPDGSQAITMFSGVFQHAVDLPFLNSVTVDNNGYTVNNTFQQYYNHYHCSTIPLYSESENEMHTVFFGGIAQFYDNAGTLVQDDNVPFVNTIARVTRDAAGDMAEYKLPIEMPALLGAGSEFIPNLNLPHFTNDVFKLDSVTTDSVLIGYIFGGISSTQPNIFFINDGTQSDAHSQIFKVYIKKPEPLSVDQLNDASISLLNLMIYPNPNDGVLNISFNLTKKEEVTISILDSKGALMDKILLQNLTAGKNVYSKNISKLTGGNVYFISLETATEKATHKLIVGK